MDPIEWLMKHQKDVERVSEQLATTLVKELPDNKGTDLPCIAAVMILCLGKLVGRFSKATVPEQELWDGILMLRPIFNYGMRLGRRAN